MSNVITTSLIAGTVSLVVSALSIWVSLKKLKHGKRKFEKQLRSNYYNLLIEKRIEFYQTAYLVTSNLLRTKPPHFLSPKKDLEEIKDKLNIWAGEAGLYMSADTAKSC